MRAIYIHPLLRGIHPCVTADVITVVSGGRVAFLDPDFALTEAGGASAELLELLEKIQRDDQTRSVSDDDGSRILLGDQDEHLVLRELLRPLNGVMGFELFSDRCYFGGTLFRLPLRMGT